MNYEGLIKTILRKLSKDREKRYKPDDAVRNQQLHVLENLDWYYVKPTEMFRRLPSLYSLFDSDGVPTHDASGNELVESTIQQLRKKWGLQKKLYEALENLALKYIPY
jgi:cysteinyl-tRNA synthetase